MNIKRAGEVRVADLVVVSNKLATYLSRPELEGEALPVEHIENYSPTVIGITLEGLPEVCAAPDSDVPVPDSDVYPCGYCEEEFESDEERTEHMAECPDREGADR